MWLRFIIELIKILRPTWLRSNPTRSHSHVLFAFRIFPHSCNLLFRPTSGATKVASAKFPIQWTFCFLARPLENVTSGPLLFPNPPVVLGKPSSALACINIIFGDTQKAYLYRHRFSVIHLPTWWPANVLRKRTRNNRRHSCQGNRNEQPSSKLTAESPSILRSNVRFSGLFFARANEKRWPKNL